MNIISIGQELTARSIGDSECIFRAFILERNKSLVTVSIMGARKRCKVFADSTGEYIYALGKYSMCPIFRAPKMELSALEESRAQMMAQY